MRVNKELEGISRCPRCNVATPRLEFQSIFTAQYLGGSPVKAWATYRCSTCDDLVAVKCTIPSNAMQYGMPAWFMGQQIEAEEVIPAPSTVDADLPDRARRYLEQALESLHAPDGAIMLAGSAIDAMLKAKGYEEGSVYARITKAVEDHVLTDGMSEWAHAVRLESNKPRHADLDEPHATRELAAQTIKFAQALGEFLFALPARIERGKEDSTKAAEDADSGNGAT